MKLPPYTVPEQDADLWECGKRLDTDPNAVMLRAELREHVLHILKRAGADGFKSGAALARELRVSNDRIQTALRDARVYRRNGRVYHPDHYPYEDD